MITDTLRSRRIDLLTDSTVGKLDRRSVALWAIGSLEPHGHLPLGIDTFIPTMILERVALQTSGAWLLPPLPFGYLFKYGAWPGSVGIPARALADFLASACGGLTQLGISRLFVMSGHDENREATLTGLRDAQGAFGVRSVYCGWIDLAMTLLPQITASGREGHGSECETSVFMHLFPDVPLVIDPVNDRIAEVRPPCMGEDDLFAPQESGTWVQQVDATMDSTSSTGSIDAASSEKGRRIVDHIVGRACEIVGALRDAD
jgi:creatinine amidohydrolase/Fe(II)-dependent formamide hydrolase-like protein